METPEDRAAHQRRLELLRRLGCRVIEEEVTTIDGRRVPTVRFAARDNAHAVAVANALAVDDAQHSAQVQRLAARFRAWADRIASRARIDRDLALARELQRYIAKRVTFREESAEEFRSSDLTLLLRWGDCDDHSRLYVALALAAGLPAHIAAVKDSSGAITHVAPAVYVGGAYRWAETTIAAEFGEDPRLAGIRLGLLARPDVTG